MKRLMRINPKRTERDSQRPNKMRALQKIRYDLMDSLKEKDVPNNNDSDKTNAARLKPEVLKNGLFAILS